MDPLCAKHDIFGSCFNSVTIDPSSINSGQKKGENLLCCLQANGTCCAWCEHVYPRLSRPDSSTFCAVQHHNVKSAMMQKHVCKMGSLLCSAVSVFLLLDAATTWRSTCRMFHGEIQRNPNFPGSYYTKLSRQLLQYETWICACVSMESAFERNVYWVQLCLIFCVKNNHAANHISNTRTPLCLQKRDIVPAELATSNATMLIPTTSPCSKYKLRLGTTTASVYLDSEITPSNYAIKHSHHEIVCLLQDALQSTQ